MKSIVIMNIGNAYFACPERIVKIGLKDPNFNSKRTLTKLFLMFLLEFVLNFERLLFSSCITLVVIHIHVTVHCILGCVMV